MRRGRAGTCKKHIVRMHVREHTSIVTLYPWGQAPLANDMMMGVGGCGGESFLQTRAQYYDIVDSLTMPSKAAKDHGCHGHHHRETDGGGDDSTMILFRKNARRPENARGGGMRGRSVRGGDGLVLRLGARGILSQPLLPLAQLRGR